MEIILYGLMNHTGIRGSVEQFGEEFAARTTQAQYEEEMGSVGPSVNLFFANPDM
jgi:hypothetical protein